MNWKYQILKKAITTRLPFYKQLRYAKRVTFGYPPDISNISTTIENLSTMKGELHKVDKSFKNSNVLEIGSGWFPVIPILLSLENTKVTMTDLDPYMDKITFKETIKCLANLYPADSRYQNIDSIDDLNIEYLAPLIINELKDSSIDYVISRTVLEHIPKSGIKNLLSALKPKLSESGLMIHLVDHSDHLEHRDKTISKINFLTLEEKKHSIINKLTKHGENRLRHHEYKEIFESSGYEILSQYDEVDDATLNICDKLNLAEPFSKMTHQQLSILTSTYILKAK